MRSTTTIGTVRTGALAFLLATLACSGDGGPMDERPLPSASAEEVGMSSEALAAIPAAMQTFVDEGRASGIITMVARQGRLVHWDAVGYSDLDSTEPMARDEILRICSMTKPVTAVGVLALVEDGLIGLDEPVSTYLPEFAGVEVYAEGDREPLQSPVTIRQLLSHTSGLTYGSFGTTPVDMMYREADIFSGDLPNLVDELTAIPLIGQPGEQWVYSVGLDVLGRVVEVASGQTFDAFLDERIFQPLGMDDTAFWVPAEKQYRFAAAYTRTREGLSPFDASLCGSYDAPPELPSGGAGLASTAADYVRFAQMLLNEGELNGRRILSPESVREMRSNQIDESLIPIGIGGPGYGFGLGVSVLVDADATPLPDNDGIFRWFGYASTYFWIDPEAELIGLVMTQLAPPTLPALQNDFQTLVYGAITP